MVARNNPFGKPFDLARSLKIGSIQLMFSFPPAQLTGKEHYHLANVTEDFASTTHQLLHGTYAINSNFCFGFVGGVVANQTLVVDAFDVMYRVHRVVAAQGEKSVECDDSLPHSLHITFQCTEKLKFAFCTRTLVD